MTTTTKVWLGFGMLIAVLVLTIVPVWFLLDSLQGQVAQIAPEREDVLATFRIILTVLAILLVAGLLIAVGGSLVIARGIAQAEETDVTQRQQGQASLQGSVEDERSRLVSIVENSADFIGISDVEGNPVFVNQAGRRLVGLPKDFDVRNTSIPEYFVPEQRAYIESDVLPAISANGRWAGELTFRHFETGEAIPVWYDLFRVDDPATGQPINFATVTRDIREQKRAEAELRESEERRRLALDAAESGAWNIDPATFEMISDERFRMIFHGCTDPLPYEEAVAAIHPDDRRQVLDSVAAATNPDDPASYAEEYRVIHSDGTIHWVYAKGRANFEMTEAGRQLASFDGTLTDITDRKKAQEELQRERDLLRVTLASIGDAVITTDIEGHITNLNAVAESLTGWTTTESERQPLEAVFRIVNEQTRETVENPAARALREGVVVGLANHTILIAKDGTERPIDDSAAPIRGNSGEIVGCVLVFRDVAQRRQAEQALSRQTRVLEALSESVLDGILIVGLDGEMIHANDQFKQVWDFPAEVVASGSDELALRWAAEQTTDPTRFLKRVSDIYAEADRSYREELAMKDGRVFERYGAPVKDDGERLGWVWTFRDITDRKQAEDSLRNFAAELSEANRRKTEFLATLGHELRNPLAPIRTGLEAMKLLDNDPDSMLEIRNTMERQVQQMVRLIDDLLDISRITQSKMELRTCQVALSDVVRSAVEATKPFIDEAGHHLSVEMPPQPILLNADPNRLAQVISNLLNNSSKYTPEGGHIQLIVQQEGSEVSITVQDDGLGIPADMLDGIFEMFTQIDRPLEKGYTGLGIGLTLVKRLVEMHNGSIEVRSEGPDQGSAFSVRLPVMIESPAAKAVPETPVGKAVSMRILVVDDNKAAATMLKMVVKMLGNEVRAANDGQEAIEVAADFMPEVVLMDLGMPKMNGYEAARHIREQSWGRDMLLVALTGWGQDEDRERTREAGFDHHLVKPAEPAAIQQLLANVNSNRQ